MPPVTDDSKQVDACASDTPPKIEVIPTTEERSAVLMFIMKRGLHYSGHLEVSNYVSSGLSVFDRSIDLL